MRKKYNVEQLRLAVAKSTRWKHVAEHLDMFYSSRLIHRWKAELEPEEYAHLEIYRTVRYRDDEVFAKHKTVLKSSTLKERAWRLGYLKKECQNCGIGEDWAGRVGLSHLELDHINGDRTDNRLENLRILCANCHSYTATYCGRKIHNKKGYL